MKKIKTCLAKTTNQGLSRSCRKSQSVCFSLIVQGLSECEERAFHTQIPIDLQSSRSYVVLSSNHMASDEDLKAEIERLRAENAALKKPTRGQMSLKVSEKGGLSVYGMGRFPITLYKEQWLKLLTMAEEIRTFIRENDAALKTKE